MKQNILEDSKDIFVRIKKRNFSGNTGMAIKNSMLQFSTNFLTKIGSLLFIIILARMLMPELFGLYSLALTTILIFHTLSELGTNQTLIIFVSKALGKNKKRTKAKDYVAYIGKLRLFLISASILVLIISAKFISTTYYQKPLFLALIAGSLYILFTGITGFLQSILIASNYFKGIFYKEIIFQVTRLIVIPLLILLSLKNLFSNEFLLFFIIIGLSFSYLVSSVFLIILSKNKIKFLAEKGKKISSLEKKKVNKFIIPVSATVITVAFFGHVDLVMLGGFVISEYIGYYSAALGLVTALAPLITFSVALLPIFSRLKNKQLERGFKKSLSITLWLSLIFSIFIFFLAPFIINIIYGDAYEFSINILKFLSLLLISASIGSIYAIYFIVKGNPGIVLKLLIVSLIVNIILNFSVILLLKDYGNLFVVYGVTGATIISSWFYMFSLILSKRKEKFKN